MTNQYSQNPLTIEEMKLICNTLSWARSEIHNPGSCRVSRIDIDERIEDAIYRLRDSIERVQAA